MAGHSQFSNIMHRKGAQDAKRAKVFGKLIRELTVAARSGQPDPASNPRLRSAIAAAKAANLPKDTMERAVKRGAGETDGESFEEIGYGPGGVAIIVEALTDNRNRTAGEVRSAFTKSGGSLGETNSVSFQFSRVGSIRYPADVGSADDVLETAIEVGADEVESDDETHEFLCAPDSFHEVREALQANLGDPQAAAMIWRPTNTVPVDDEGAASTLFKLIEALDDNDDVQTVSSNFEVSDAVLENIGG